MDVGLIYTDVGFITFRLLLILNFGLYRHIQKNTVAHAYPREISEKFSTMLNLIFFSKLVQTSGDFHHEMGAIIYHFVWTWMVVSALICFCPVKSSEPPRIDGE